MGSGPPLTDGDSLATVVKRGVFNNYKLLNYVTIQLKTSLISH